MQRNTFGSCPNSVGPRRLDGGVAETLLHRVLVGTVPISPRVCLKRRVLNLQGLQRLPSPGTQPMRNRVPEDVDARSNTADLYGRKAE